MTAAKHVSRPDHLRIGIHLYEVLWFNEDEWLSAHLSEGADGLTYCSNNVIYMRLIPNRRESQYQEVLLHEAQHAVWSVAGLNPDDGWDKCAAEDVEERAIYHSTPWLLMLMRDNPHFMQYILKVDDKVR